MSEFTILRFYDCNRSVLQGIRQHKQWLFLWGAAVLLLFWNLGTGAFTAAECISASAAQTLLDKPDILPGGNGFLTRLVWLFSSSSGVVTEISARLPVAMGALLVLGAVIAIAHKLFGRSAALASGWFCLTTVGFLFIGRLVAADMTLAAIMLWSIALYLFSREKMSLCSSLLFWLLISFGFYAGGFFAFFPVVVMICDIVFRKQLRNLLQWRNITGIFCGIAVYVALDKFCDFRCHDFGISLRVEPGTVLNMSLPWTPLFIFAFFDMMKRKNQIPDSRLLFYCFLITFLCAFVLKNTVVPLLGFAAVACGVMLTASPATVPQLFSKLLFRLADALLPVFSLVLLLTPVLFKWLAPRYLPDRLSYPNWFVAVFYFAAPVVGVLIFIWQTLLIRRRKQKKAMPEICGADPVPDRVIPVFAFLLLLLFAMIFPGMASDPVFCSRKPFLLQTKEILQKQYGLKHPQCIYLLPGKAEAECKIYLERGEKISPVQVMQNPSEMLAALKKHGGALVGLQQDFARYEIPLTGLVFVEPVSFSDPRSSGNPEKLAVLLFMK
ncbi:MAG: hypothetical protein IKB16_14580 [Lentisphaeria bacterium]|nr:hypothetical protein [Lentisphaeria bacterium]